MHLEIEQREKEGIAILDLKGRLILGPEDLALRERLQAIHQAGAVNVILNFAHVTDIDSTSLGSLAFFGAKFREAGGKLAVLNLAPAHAELPEILKLNTVFDVFQLEQDALNSFFPERAVPHFDILEFVEHQEPAVGAKNDPKKDQPG
jgi:anti-sigma B factor antagonist